MTPICCVCGANLGIIYTYNHKPYCGKCWPLRKQHKEALAKRNQPKKRGEK